MEKFRSWRRRRPQTERPGVLTTSGRGREARDSWDSGAFPRPSAWEPEHVSLPRRASPSGSKTPGSRPQPRGDSDSKGEERGVDPARRSPIPAVEMPAPAPRSAPKSGCRHRSQKFSLTSRCSSVRSRGVSSAGIRASPAGPGTQSRPRPPASSQGPVGGRGRRGRTLRSRARDGNFVLCATPGVSVLSTRTPKTFPAEDKAGERRAERRPPAGRGRAPGPGGGACPSRHRGWRPASWLEKQRSRPCEPRGSVK